VFCRKQEIICYTLPVHCLKEKKKEKEKSLLCSPSLQCYNMPLQLDEVENLGFPPFELYCISTVSLVLGRLKVVFTSILNQRLRERAQNVCMYISVLDNKKLNIYSQCKSVVVRESYIASVHTVTFSWYDLYDHCLAIETCRWNNIPMRERICSSLSKGTQQYVE